MLQQQHGDTAIKTALCRRWLPDPLPAAARRAAVSARASRRCAAARGAPALAKTASDTRGGWGRGPGGTRSIDQNMRVYLSI